MIFKDKAQILCIIILTPIFISYHLSNYFFQSFMTGDDLLTILRICQFFIAFGIFVAGLKSKWLNKIIFSDDYISGNYSGLSRRFEKDEADEKRNYNIDFIIKQSPFYMTISGKSFSSEDKIKSTWEGILFKKDEQTFYFALTVTAKAGIELGVMAARFFNGDISGFYFAGASESMKYSFDATRNSENKNK